MFDFVNVDLHKSSTIVQIDREIGHQSTIKGNSRWGFNNRKSGNYVEETALAIRILGVNQP